MEAKGMDVVRFPDGGPKGIIKRIKKGMSYKELLLLQAKLGVDKEMLAGLLKISPRTFERRRVDGRIDSQETDRALRLGRIIQRAIEMYDGDEGAAKAWLRQSVPALEGMKPLELIETEAGAVLVESLIGRIEAGVYS
jgi:putative toxin-antitoxin system antitoxin component (TIGR02293 family)